MATRGDWEAADSAQNRGVSELGLSGNDRVGNVVINRLHSTHISKLLSLPTTQNKSLSNCPSICIKAKIVAGRGENPQNAPPA